MAAGIKDRNFLAQKIPLWKRWWVWLLVIVLLLACDYWQWFRIPFWGNPVHQPASASTVAIRAQVAEAAPMPAKPQPIVSGETPAACVAVRLTVPPGKDRTVRYVMVRGAPINNFDCRGVIERTWQTPWSNYCGPGCRHPWHKDILEYMDKHFPGGKSFKYFESSFYRLHADRDARGAARPTEVMIILPRAATEGGIAVCVKADKKAPPTYLIRPDSWRGLGIKPGSRYGKEYIIPADFFYGTWNPPSG